MANPLKDKLQARFLALQAKRAETVAQHQGVLATLDAEIAALRSLAQRWDSMTVDEALSALEQAGIRLDVQA